VDANISPIKHNSFTASDEDSKVPFIFTSRLKAERQRKKLIKLFREKGFDVTEKTTKQ
jgi:hypothetical protein